MRLYFFIILFVWCININAGTVVTSVTTLPSFGSVYVFNSSEPNRVSISGSNLSATVTITAPVGFEVSLLQQSRFGKSLTLMPSNGQLASTIVYVRFSPSTTGNLSGNINILSLGSNSINIALQGTGINWSLPANYYTTTQNLRGAALNTALFNKISSGTSTVSYTPGVWNAFATTDVYYNGKIWDIYSTSLAANPPYEFTLFTHQDQGSGGNVEGQFYNREHSFPQSWFAQASPMVSDLHHIFATDKFINAQRGDLPFGAVASANWTSLIGNKRGTSGSNGYTGIVFEPTNDYKGDIARAQFYMATRYQNSIAGWQNNATADVVLAGNAFPVYDAWFLNVLLSWHELDPVSDKEIKRNNAIFNLQGNRNPYIDSPHFVQRIWGGSIAPEPTLAAVNMVITNNSSTSVTVNWTSGNGSRRILLIKAGSTITNLPTDTFNYNANANISIAPQIAAGTFIAYNGTGSSVTLTNLNPNVNYYYTLIEYNGFNTTANYNITNILQANAQTLPVSWLSFNAVKENNQVYLQWQTAQEINNKGFDIERSFNGIYFEQIGFVKGNENTNNLSNYNFTDNLKPTALEYQTIYYRLKQIDFDAGKTYSKIIKINNTLNNVDWEVLPNPATGTITINAQDFNEGEVIIYQITGNCVLKNKFNSHLSLDVSAIPSGIYFIQLHSISKNYNSIKKIIIN